MNIALRRVFFGWWILAAGSVIQALGSGIITFGFAVFFLPVERDLGVSRTTLSLAFGARSLEGGIVGPAAGWAIDRFGPRKVIFIGVGMVGVGLLLLAAAPNFLSFFLIFVFVIGIGYNTGFFHAVSTAVNSWFIRNRGIALGILASASGLGGVALVPLLSFLVLSQGWRLAAVVAGMVILILAVPMALPFHRTPESRGLRPDGMPPQSRGSTTQAAGPAEVDLSLGQAMRTGNFWLLTLSITLRVGVTHAVLVHLVPIVVWKGLDEGTGAYLVGLYAFLSIAAPLVLGWLGDRWSKTMVSALGALSGLVGLVLVLLTQGAVSGYILAISLALIMGTTPLNWALIGDFFGRRSYASLRGMMGLVYSLATFVSPVYAGWVFDRTQSYAEALIVFSVILAVVTPLFALLRAPSPLQQAPRR